MRNVGLIALVCTSGLALTACASSSASGPFTPSYATKIPERPTGREPPAARRKPAGPPATAGSSRGGTWKPYQVRGVWYYPAEQPDYDEVGIASWYGDAFNGKPTATGEIFDMYALSAAHKTLPLPSIVEVTNLDNGRSMRLRVNDRGPFVDNRIIDLSRGAAEELGVIRTGLARVRVRYVGPADGRLADPQLQYATAPRPKPPTPAPRPVPVAAPPPEPAPQTELASAPAEQDVARADPPASAPTVSEPVAMPPARRIEVQAGAFASRANAERAVLQLGSAGQAEIREIERNGTTLYRVVVSGAGDDAMAGDMLGRVAASGYRDAVILRAN